VDFAQLCASQSISFDAPPETGQAIAVESTIAPKKAAKHRLAPHNAAYFFAEREKRSKGRDDGGVRLNTDKCACIRLFGTIFLIRPGGRRTLPDAPAMRDILA